MIDTVCALLTGRDAQSVILFPTCDEKAVPSRAVKAIADPHSRIDSELPSYSKLVNDFKICSLAFSSKSSYVLVVCRTNIWNSPSVS